jgi:hypothetical protein
VGETHKETIKNALVWDEILTFIRVKCATRAPRALAVKSLLDEGSGASGHKPLRPSEPPSDRK